ncbi:RidA family protein [Kitasatospora sp. NPDC054939]
MIDESSAAAHVTHIPEPAGVAPATGYTQVVTGTGRLVVVSGQVALDEQGAVVGAGDARAQAEQVFENLRRCLAAAGADFADVVKFGYFLTDLAHLVEVREVRDRFLAGVRPPASTAVQVSGLFKPELLMEIEAYAVVPDGRPA